VESLDEKLQRARALCLDQAAGFVSAAERLGGGAEWPYVVYHRLLALEEVGKASMLGARMVNHDKLNGSWLNRSLDNHRRKLQWAVWSPMVSLRTIGTAVRFVSLPSHSLIGRTASPTIFSVSGDTRAEP